MKHGLECWKCGGSLAELELPIGRLDRCPGCLADLHVCKLCRHYDSQVLGQCRHERAERLVDKELANFCTYFRPRPHAHDPERRSASDLARAELDSVFGRPDTAEDTTGVAAAAERSRAELDALFGAGADEQTRPDPSDGARKSEAERARDALDALFGKDD